MNARQTSMSGWGRTARATGPVLALRDEAALAEAIAGGGVIARGLGRAYGDAALGARVTLDMRGWRRMLAFEDGWLTAEAGVSLADIVAAFLPRGWFPAVTPGTSHVTLGGAFAADVHGKNHRDGSFADHVDWIEIMGPDGVLRRAGPGEQAFDAARGGMGLTGVILRMRTRLIPVETAFIRQETVVTGGLGEMMAALEDAEDWPYSVAWIDCLARGAELGRGLVFKGRHALREDIPPDRLPFALPKRRRLTLPVMLPGFALNGLTMRSFNAAYFALVKRKSGRSLVDAPRYFYPLDAVAHWHRAYGPQGFYQFQCVLPQAEAETGLRRILEQTGASGQGSFLAVLKRLCERRGPHSFPMDGYTIALDFPARAGPLVDRLAAIAAEHGARFYLAKDARLDAATLARSDPAMTRLADMRRDDGLAPVFASKLSERLSL